MMRCKGFIPITNHLNDHFSLSSVHNEWFTNHIHTFTPITRIVAIKRQTETDREREREYIYIYIYTNLINMYKTLPRIKEISREQHVLISCHISQAKAMLYCIHIHTSRDATTTRAQGVSNISSPMCYFQTRHLHSLKDFEVTETP